jgi:diguanylate cyclase (GGDEF)-like protein/putative nucleotidyltransferase with HDIG domain
MIRHNQNIKLTNATRISVGLVLIVLSALGVGYSIGLLPSHSKERTEGQLDMAKSLAIQFSAAVESNNAAHIQDLGGSIVGSLPDVASIGLRRITGQLVFATVNHAIDWQAANDVRFKNQFQPVKVPIFNQNKQWGQLEIAFHRDAGVTSDLVRLLGFIAAICLAGFMLFMKRTLKVLDPSQVIPERVRSMLDTLTEGAVITDGDGRIVLVNQSFADILGASTQSLLGVELSQLPWKNPSGSSPADVTPGSPTQTILPWNKLSGDLRSRGTMVQLQTGSSLRSLVVNASSILGGKGALRGCVFTFDDVTRIERKNQQLVEMVRQLGEAQQRVQKQNDELQRLATRDVLTGCLNRRAFHEQLATLFAHCARQRQPLSVVMVDIDHFKLVNDNHGHARGDQVLREVANRLRTSVRGADVLTRYGGEEFCVLVPATDLRGAHLLAEKLRTTIADKPIDNLPVTISLGISCSSLGAQTAQALIAQADEALYNSKRAGRNRSTRFDRCDATPAGEFEERHRASPSADEHIPIEAVRCLFSALSFRDPQTAQHSQRVSDLCVKVGATWLNARDLFILETAALLHDIGKVGVPDSVLLKAGPLTEDEWTLMREHDRIGVEIVRTAFNCSSLTAIIANHHSRHEWSGDTTRLAAGEFIPQSARLLAIADAYDAMTTNRCYRAAIPHDAAVAELRRCAGTQFDPRLVEHFVNMISEVPNPAPSAPESERIAKALRLGMEAELVAGKLIERDIESAVALANHLAQTAAAYGDEEISQRCQRITASAQSSSDPQTLLSEACDLLDAVSRK